MPADERFWRNLKTMHIVFAVSSAVLFFVTIMMLHRDHADEWREYQTTWDQIEAAKLQQQYNAVDTEEFRGRIRDLETQLASAQESIDQEQVAALNREIDDLQLRVQLTSQSVRGQRAGRDKARADYDVAVAQGRYQADLDELSDQFKTEQRRVDELEAALQLDEIALSRKREELQALTATRDRILAELAAAQTEAERLRTARQQVAPDSLFSSTKRKIMQLPIIDGFNSPHEIKQDWLPELKFPLGMAESARFDRCRTCHLGIDRVEVGDLPAFPHGHPETEDVDDWVAKNEFPHPFATHPNPKLYLTPSSPHPVATFGCTVCHEGQGSGTSFSNAAHTPNNPHIEHEWSREHEYASNHFWEYPMLPARFEESTCLKCHHNVTELAQNPKWGATAPQVHRGFQLIEKFGCFGCHEVHGFDGDKRIGPDLRLEPNYWAAALQLISDPSVPDDPNSEEAAQAGQMLTRISRLAHEVARRPAETTAQRQELRRLVLADKNLETPQLSMQSLNLADELKELDHPGEYRKVGPSLRHLAAKTYRGWIEYWTEDPQRFRPATNMPKFFHLSNQDDPHAVALQPVELAGIAEYLLAKSQPLNLMSPAEGYEPDPERGQKMFSQRGCLSCHSHKDFADIASDFGPQLDRVHEKLLPGEQGFNWLYTWIRDPHRHSPRTRMPNLFLEPEGEGVDAIDPAADIAAWLLEQRPETPQYTPLEMAPYIGVAVDQSMSAEEAALLGLDSPRGVRILDVMPHSPATRVTLADSGSRGTAELMVDDVILAFNSGPIADAAALESQLQQTPVGTEVQLTIWRAGFEQTASIVVDEPLNDLVRLYLSKTLKNPQVEDTFTKRNYPFKASQIKGDEIELSREATGTEHLSDEDWRSMKLRYVGRRTISRYGCYGCHDVPGFESARPIGTALQDWGRKDSSKLALEHIEEYLHHHGEPDGESTRERVINGMEAVESDEFKSRLRKVENDLKKLRQELTQIDKSIKTADDPEELQMRRAGLVVDIERAEAAVVRITGQRESAMTAAFFYDSLLHHGRPGFIWQKLRQPRSYDHLKIGTKGYDERLRMPKFPLEEDEIEAVATFVLGLVAEPPAPQYVYQPGRREQTRIDGEQLLTKYNCTSCHMIDLPRISYGLELKLPETDGLADAPSFTNSFEDLVTWLAEHPGAIQDGQLNRQKSAQESAETLDAIEADLQVLSQLGFDLADLGRLSRPGSSLEARRLQLNRWFSVRASVGMTGDDLATWIATHAGGLRDGSIDAASYPPSVQRMVGLGAKLSEIAQLTAHPQPQTARANVAEWLADHPEVRLTTDLQNDEFVAGVSKLMELKPPVNGDTIRSHHGLPVIEFDGLLRTAPDPEETDPEFRYYSYQLFKTLEVAGRVLLPGNTMSFIETQREDVQPARGGPFAEWLVGQLSMDEEHKSYNNRSKAWEAVPPPLYIEGQKVQTAWLYRFLKNPDRIRYETVLRMPRFNMSDEEAHVLANYFAAVDGAEYPYDEIPQREEAYLTSREQMLQSLENQSADEPYLPTAWQVLTRNDLCIGCHALGGRDFKAGDDPSKVTHGPDLQRVPDRLRPEYLQLWLYKPAWVLPYTSMPAPGSKPVQGLFDNDPQMQAVALRDALLNYHRLMEREVRTLQQNGGAGTTPPAGESSEESTQPDASQSDTTDPADAESSSAAAEAAEEEAENPSDPGANGAAAEGAASDSTETPAADDEAAPTEE